MFSEQLIETQDIPEALPGETVGEVTEIPQTDIAKEQKVEMEAKESTEATIVPG